MQASSPSLLSARKNCPEFARLGTRTSTKRLSSGDNSTGPCVNGTLKGKFSPAPMEISSVATGCSNAKISPTLLASEHIDASPLYRRTAARTATGDSRSCTRKETKSITRSVVQRDPGKQRKKELLSVKLALGLANKQATDDPRLSSTPWNCKRPESSQSLGHCSCCCSSREDPRRSEPDSSAAEVRSNESSKTNRKTKDLWRIIVRPLCWFVEVEITCMRNCNRRRCRF